MEKAKHLESVKNGKDAQGKRWLIKHLEGGVLTPVQAISAYCYDCMGFFDDGKREDCGIETCPLHQHMRYNKNRRKSIKRQAPERQAA